MRNGLILATLLVAQPVAAQDFTFPVHETWAVIEGNEFSDDGQVKLDRRYAFTEESMVNYMVYNCPLDPSTFVHFSLEFGSILNAEQEFETNFGPISTRFLANRSAFSLPGEIILTAMFFDRTSETYLDFDRVASAVDLTVIVGQNNRTVRFAVTEGMNNMIGDVLARFGAPAQIMTTQEMFDVCVRLRGAG